MLEFGFYDDEVENIMSYFIEIIDGRKDKTSK